MVVLGDNCPSVDQHCWTVCEVTRRRSCSLPTPDNALPASCVPEGRFLLRRFRQEPSIFPILEPSHWEHFSIDMRGGGFDQEIPNPFQHPPVNESNVVRQDLLSRSPIHRRSRRAFHRLPNNTARVSSWQNTCSLRCDARCWTY